MKKWTKLDKALFDAYEEVRKSKNQAEAEIRLALKNKGHFSISGMTTKMLASKLQYLDSVWKEMEPKGYVEAEVSDDMVIFVNGFTSMKSKKQSWSIRLVFDDSVGWQWVNT